MAFSDGLTNSEDPSKETKSGCTARPGLQEKKPKLQPSWQGPYKVITHINNVVFRIPQHPMEKIFVHPDRRSPYLQATRDQKS
jgi:hypothetical protein